MAETNCYGSVCLVGIMDQLWFHQAILFLDPNTSFFCGPKHLSTEPPELPAREEPITSSDQSPTPTPAVTSMDEPSEIEEEINKEKERPTRANSGLTPTERRVRRAFSLSPSAHTRPGKCSIEPSKRMLKSMSCRSFADLEMEEVRGFMDLGFIFKKEHLSPRIVSVVPGLQRLAVLRKKQSQLLQEDEKQSDGITTEEGQGEMLQYPRPYLSEAWLIRRPDSPLLNLRVPRASPAAEMKRHLRSWAKAVACVVEQES
ncbi:uncharacterized protein LOC116206973 [Punica granatum]|uniref:Uncharacterized protein LOC116206973 n=2 Tax=Punica granatum TaxID=22663 RepID=A0A6P8DEL1_PUNGR|nr:uncharacterized protein LOC116206973 [Punica granatum]PKI65178.1 hypothetical protein CRG98_014492 [Punica granatum]